MSDSAYAAIHTNTKRSLFNSRCAYTQMSRPICFCWVFFPFISPLYLSAVLRTKSNVCITHSYQQNARWLHLKIVAFASHTRRSYAMISCRFLTFLPQLIRSIASNDRSAKVQHTVPDTFRNGKNQAANSNNNNITHTHPIYPLRMCDLDDSERKRVRFIFPVSFYFHFRQFTRLNRIPFRLWAHTHSMKKIHRSNFVFVSFFCCCHLLSVCLRSFITHHIGSNACCFSYFRSVFPYFGCEV